MTKITVVPPEPLPPILDRLWHETNRQQMARLREITAPMRARRLAWETAHPYRAQWQRLVRPVRKAAEELRWRLRILFTGDCGHDG